MNAPVILAKLERLAVRVAIDGDSLVVDAPRGILSTALQAELRANKTELIGLLTTALTSSAEPTHQADWTTLAAQRWGTSLHHDLPGIVVPRGWRSRVAGLPHEAWVRWRARVDKLLQDLGRSPTADEIRETDRRSAAEMGIPEACPGRERLGEKVPLVP